MNLLLFFSLFLCLNHSLLFNFFSQPFVHQNILNQNPESLKWTAGIQRRKGVDHVQTISQTNLRCLCLCLRDILESFGHPASVSVMKYLSEKKLKVLTDGSCVCPLSLGRTTCLRHHRLQGSWTLAATTRTCTRPRRRATLASFIMTTTWYPGPWRPSFTIWFQLLTIIQMWVLVLLYCFYPWWFLFPYRFILFCL